MDGAGGFGPDDQFIKGELVALGEGVEREVGGDEVVDDFVGTGEVGGLDGVGDERGIGQLVVDDME